MSWTVHDGPTRRMNELGDTVAYLRLVKDERSNQGSYVVGWYTGADSGVALDETDARKYADAALSKAGWILR